jgi:ubiquinone/menaquinone biosynthesis C-methylase UbiE
MKNENNYIIKGGEEGKKRLGLLSEILETHSRSFIESVVNLKGKRFLDVGSGGGHVSLMASDMVGRDGQITAIDFDAEIIRLAAEDAKGKGVENITYSVMDAYKLDYENEFDVAYARFLLSHLQHPEVVLSKMISSVKKDGAVIIEDIDFSGHFCYPHSDAFMDYVRYFSDAALNNGQHPDIGKQLLSMFKNQNQLYDIRFDVIQPVFESGDGKWMAYITMDKIKDSLLQQGLANQDEIEKTLSALKLFTENKNSVISLPRIFRVSGLKS